MTSTFANGWRTFSLATMRALRPSETISRTRRHLLGKRLHRLLPARRWENRHRCTLASARSPVAGHGQVLPHGFGQEGDERRHHLARSSTGIRTASNRRRACRRSTHCAQNRSRLRRKYQLLRASTKPVICRAGGEVVVLVHALHDGGGRAVQFAQNPAVELAPLSTRRRSPWHRPALRPPSDPHRSGSDAGRIEAVDVGVDHEEAVDVPQPQQELGNAVLDRLFAVADRGPGRLVGEEVPAQGVGPVLVEDFARLAVVPLALATSSGRLRPASAPARCSCGRDADSRAAEQSLGNRIVLARRTTSC